MNLTLILLLFAASPYSSLVSELQSSSYATRTDAYVALDKAGEPAIPELQKTYLESRDRHVKFCCEKIIRGFAEKIKPTKWYALPDISALPEDYPDKHKIIEKFAERNREAIKTNTIVEAVIVPELLSGKPIAEVQELIDVTVENYHRDILDKIYESIGVTIKGDVNGIPD